MADSKNYFVQYNIVANAQEAIKNITALGKVAEQYQTAMKTISTNIKDLASAVSRLKEISSITFSASIDTQTFKGQLNAMEAAVKESAARMHSALYGALAGNKPATQAMKSGFDGMTKKQLQDQLKAYNKELDKLIGAKGKNGVRNSRKGDIAMKENSIAQAKLANKATTQLENDLKTLETRREQLKREIARINSAITALDNKPASTIANKPQDLKAGQRGVTTNVTPATIREWERVFGKSKSRTLTLTIKAIDQASTVINPIMKSMAAIKASGTFEINPILNSASFIKAQEELSKLAAISKTVTAPLSNINVGKSGKPKKGQVTTTGAASKPTGTTNLTGNVTKITVSAPETTVPIIGNITKIKNGVTKPISVSVNAKISKSQISAAIKEITPPTITAYFKLKWADGAVGKQKQLKAITDNIPPIKLKLDISGALQSLKAFVSEVRAVSPQNIVLGAVGTAGGATTTGTSGSTSTTTTTTRKPRKSRTTSSPKVSSGEPSVQPNESSFYKNARSFMFPLTGPTSFGQRTPMAVDMAKGMGVMYAIGGAMSAIGSSFGQAMDYQNVMETTKAILQSGTETYSNSGYSNMERIIRDVGIKTKFSAPEVADAARFLAMAGYDINAINNAIRPIADLALIGDSDLGETADKMTNIMQTFKIAPEKMREVANVMTTTVTRTNTDLMMLAESAKYGGGVANLYGMKDPNLFASTMAIFGVMGNAGIQASSAGTALRMMYQNIFNPNNKQKAVLKQLEERGIKTKNEDGSFRSMSDIIIDIADKVNPDELAPIVGKLFRITAQPGAQASLIAAASGNAKLAKEIENGDYSNLDKIDAAKGFSTLSKLIQANIASQNSNISGAIAERKQNTIKGLWAQVTSTFTEGIVRAFENKQDYFADILKKLKGYFADPETVKMLQSFLDLIIEVGKVLAYFAKIWADIYNTAPGLIKTWITVQMFFTQLGTLASPVIQLISVFDQLKRTMMAMGAVNVVSGAQGAGSIMGAAGNVTAGGAVMASSFMNRAMPNQFANIRQMTGSTTPYTNQVNNALRSSGYMAMANNTGLLLSGSWRDHNHNTSLSEVRRGNSLNSYNRPIPRAVQDLRQPGYWKQFAKALSSGGSILATVGMWFVGLWDGIKSFFLKFASGLGALFRLIVNPYTALIAIVGYTGYKLYDLGKQVAGTTDAQIKAREKMNEAFDKANASMHESQKWYRDWMEKEFPTKTGSVNDPGKTEAEKEYDERAQSFKNQSQSIINNDDINQGGIKDVINLQDQLGAWLKDNPQLRLMLGNYGAFESDILNNTLDSKPLPFYSVGIASGAATATMRLMTQKSQIQSQLKKIQQSQMANALMTFGFNDPKVQSALQEITSYYKQYLAGSITKEKYDYETNRIKGTFEKPDSYKPFTGSYNDFQRISDPTRYQQYHQGIWNLLNAYINAEDGTLTGTAKALNLMKDTKALDTKEKMDNALKNIIGNYVVLFNTLDDKDGINKQISLKLKMLDDGRIDYADTEKQIKSVVENYKINLAAFAEIVGEVYDLISKDNLDFTYPGGKEGFISSNVQHLMVSREDAARYWKNLPTGHTFRKNYSLEDFVDVATSTTDIRSLIDENGIPRSPGYIRGLIRNSVAKGGANSTSSSVNTHNPNNNPNDNVDQNPYASGYSQNAARPTQVIFNIDKMANFDRTMIASSAEERDLMASMEQKISEAVFRIFSEAANQAQQVIDLA